MTVNFGTSAHATAVTSLAPSRAIPPASYSLPTMKPVMFCRKRSGTRRLQASSTKCAPLAADSPKRTPLLARIDLLAVVARDQAVELVRVGRRGLGVGDLPGRGLRRQVEVANDLADEREGVFVGGRVVVGDAREARMDVGAAELLRGHVLAGGGLHERGAADEDRAGSLDDDRLVAPRRDVGAPRRARAHHRGDLRDALRGEAGLVVEDPAEVVAVGEDLGLEGEEGAARVDQIDAWKAVLFGDLLGA